MTSEESRRLAMAQRVWHETQPSDDEIDRAVQRMQMTSGRRPARAHRVRMGPALAIAVVLIAVLAYAAPGSRAGLAGLSKRVFGSAGGAEAAPVASVLPPGTPAGANVDQISSPSLGGAAELPVADAPPKAPEPSSADRPDTGKAEADRKSAGASDAKGRAATWQVVNRALAAGDDGAAAGALRELERTASDRATRAKARLGLAQLAVGRGDCRAARRLAQSVATTPNLDEKIVQRAHTVLLRCELR